MRQQQRCGKISEGKREVLVRLQLQAAYNRIFEVPRSRSIPGDRQVSLTVHASIGASLIVTTPLGPPLAGYATIRSSAIIRSPVSEFLNIQGCVSNVLQVLSTSEAVVSLLGMFVT